MTSRKQRRQEETDYYNYRHFLDELRKKAEGIYKAKQGAMVSPHFLDQEMPIGAVLVALSSGENRDGEPFDAMMAAAHYIKRLEEELTSDRLKAYKRNIEYYDLYGRFNALQAIVARLRLVVEEAQGEGGDGKTASFYAMEVARLRDEVETLKSQLTAQRRMNEQRNRELDALGYVWCDGGCAGGVLRYHRDEQSAKRDLDRYEENAEKITWEIVAAAIDNVNRLASWFNARQSRLRHAGKPSQSLAGLPKRQFVTLKLFERWQRHYDGRIARLENLLATRDAAIARHVEELAQGNYLMVVDDPKPSWENLEEKEREHWREKAREEFYATDTAIVSGEA